MTPTLHVDDALTFLEQELSTLARAKRSMSKPHLAGAFGCQVWLHEIAWRYWLSREDNGLRPGGSSTDLTTEYLDPFGDAAWHLCRIGVLRPGPEGSRFQNGAPSGGAFTLTAHGVEWAIASRDRLPVDPSRFVEQLGRIARDYGSAFLPRASEAASCYRAGNYLACCAMAGAAAEAILIAVAAAKVGGLDEALSTYRASGGRGKLTRKVIDGTSGPLRDGFTSVSSVIGYWRDEAAHGASTTISEVEASMALTHLLRFAQLVHDNWRVLAD